MSDDTMCQRCGLWTVVGAHRDPMTCIGDLQLVVARADSERKSAREALEDFAENGIPYDWPGVYGANDLLMVVDRYVRGKARAALKKGEGG